MQNGMSVWIWKEGWLDVVEDDELCSLVVRNDERIVQKPDCCCSVAPV